MTRLAVCGGVYANPFSLRAMLDDAEARGCERVFCLGDLGGFGAGCDAVWPLLVQGGVECVAGNYDLAIGRGDTDCGCGYTDPRDSEFAQTLYDYTLAHTGADFAAWMRELPLQHHERFGGLEVRMVHGSPLAVNDFMWESLGDEALEWRLDAAGRPDVLLCTHTGLHWQRRVGDSLIVNVGAVGRPANDGRREVWYVVLELDDAEARAAFVPVAYDWQAHAASMRAAGLPEPFVETIETGWWTTCLEVVPPVERARGRYHVYRDRLPGNFEVEGVGWADAPSAAPDARPVTPLFGSPHFPPRLWVYTNFHCNVACEYCVVASSPHANPRSLGIERFRALVDEAVAEGFSELYVTGGEPFVEREIVTMLEYAAERLPTVVLTNAMLFTGRRAVELARLAGHEGLVLQTSLDGADPATHDAWRGEGSWRKALDGVAVASDLGLRLRVAMTATPENGGRIDELRALLAGLGVAEQDFAVRPLVRRGFAGDVDVAAEIGAPDIVPELTVTADGVHWHPLGADLASSPDMLVAAGAVPLAQAKRLVTQRFLEMRLADGTLPQPFQCAL